MREIEQKEGEKRISIQTKRICPVCGKEIHEVNLPDAKGIVEENLYHQGEVRIVDSDVHFLVSCEHRYVDMGVTMENPHAINVLVKGLFDDRGNCLHFEVTEIRAGR